jgi:hypothetical protein
MGTVKDLDFAKEHNGYTTARPLADLSSKL